MKLLALKSSRTLVCVAAVAVLCLAGCGGADGPERTTVQGTVTLDDQPIEKGEILFLPADGQGRPDAGQITNGAYEFEVTPGAKRVEITATREMGQAPDGLPNYVMYIPAKYNTSSELTATVEADGENNFPFDLKSK